MAVKLVKDLEELIETYTDDINEDMTLSTNARTATSVAHRTGFFQVSSVHK